MRKIIFLCLLSGLFIQCHKENSPNSQIKDVIGFTWEVFRLQKTNDPFINPIAGPLYFQLNNDRHFTFSLHGVAGTGNFAWQQLDSINAKLAFTINNWNFPVADTQFTNKLKDILMSVDSVHYLKPPYLLPTLFWGLPAMELQFIGTAGHFYVLRN